MHEMGVVLNVVKALDEYAAENNIPQISGVVMEIGEVSSVEANYFAAAWEPASARSRHLVDSVLEIEMVKGIGCCRDCGKEFNLLEGDGKCTYCKSENWQLISGRDIMIKEILVEEGA